MGLRGNEEGVSSTMAMWERPIIHISLFHLEYAQKSGICLFYAYFNTLKYLWPILD